MLIYGIDFPLEIVIVVLLGELILVGGFVFFGMYWMDIREKCPELDVMKRARDKQRPPIIALVDLAGRIMMFNGYKDKPNDVKLKDDNYGLKIDARIASKVPNSRLEDGVSLWFYGVNMHFPTDLNGARGIVQLVNKIRKEYKQLNFIRDDVVLLELLTKSGDDLKQDIKKIRAMYPSEVDINIFGEGNTDDIYTGYSTKEQISLIKSGENLATPDDEELVEIFEEIKGKLKNWRVESGYFSMQDAMKLLPIGTTSSDMQRVESITKIKTQNECSKPLEWWQQLAPLFILGVSAMVIAYMIITAMKPG